MGKTKILYLHGIGSGANSRTPTVLGKEFPDAEIYAPELPARPAEAAEFVGKLNTVDGYDIVVGTSLGGFYAQTMFLQKKVLVNPAMFADEDIEKGVGRGYHEFLTARSDGARGYVIDDSFIGELREIRKKLYLNADMLYPEKMDVNELNCTYALFGEKDELVGHYDDFCRLYLPEHAFRFPGGHRLNPEEIRDSLVPVIKRALSEDSPLCFIFDEDF